MAAKRPTLRDRPVLHAPGAATADDLLMGSERQRQEVQELPLNEIMPNRHQPRTTRTELGIDELAASIRAHGVLQPILVQAISLRAYEGHTCRYELVAGERRWRASQRAGNTSIPAIVLGETVDDRQLLILALIENLQREDLSPLDEGLAFAQLQADFGLTQHQIAERMGKGRGYVQNRIRLTTVSPDLQQLAAERPDTLTHIYEIARVDDPQARAELIAAVRDDRISYAETRARVAALLAPPSDAMDGIATNNDLRKSLDEPVTSNDLRKSLASSTLARSGTREGGVVVDRASAEGTPFPPAAAGVVNAGHGEALFLSPAERTVLATVASRIEGGAALPDGDDLVLLLRLALLVAALVPDEPA